MNLLELQHTAEEVSNMMKLLSAPKRLLILCHLVDGERSVGEISRQVDMKAPATSQQLALLRRENIVSARREGQTLYYSIVDENMLLLMKFLYDTFCNKSDNLGES